MVQVDVFWSYGLGSLFALSAFRQLRKLQAESGTKDPRPDSFDLQVPEAAKRLVRKLEKGDVVFNNQYFTKTLLFLSLLFVPSGANLLWSVPDWETMQVSGYEKIPGWLVSGFTFTNVTQGILGYWVTYNLLMKGKYYRAALQTTIAHLAFWFILVNGWDKKGYQRFFSKDRRAFENWKWTNFFPWLGSDVVRILIAYGTVFTPVMLNWMTKWFREGYEMEEGLERPEDKYEKYLEIMRLDADLLFVMFGITMDFAIVAHLLIRWFGWVFGGTATAAAVYSGLIGKRGIGPWLFKRIMKVDSLEGPPVWELLAAEDAFEEELASIGT
jgi:hypothetical protein